MTNVYFVRHAEPNRTWCDNSTMPLTAEGTEDSKRVTKLFRHLPIDLFLSSPYKRSIDTISESASAFGKEIITDSRFRERESGKGGNTLDLMRRRWECFDFCEPGGESLAAVQHRNIAALTEVLSNHRGKSIVIGTHGTALSTILNYFEPNYNFDSFFRIIDFMPYVLKISFDKLKNVSQEEMLIIKKDFK